MHAKPSSFADRVVLGRLALAAVVIALAGPTAHADRGCLGDPLLTGRTCSEVECVALQAAVISACKSPAPTSCNNISGCGALRAMKQRWLNCAVARDTINARCWAGGDPGHQQASAQAWQNVGNCEMRIALPEPVGCADPCPQIPGTAPIVADPPTDRSTAGDGDTAAAAPPTGAEAAVTPADAETPN